MHYISNLFSHYGYIVLVAGLFIEFIGFPTPGSIMMSYCGYLIFQGKLNYFHSIFFAALGVFLGITTSYFVGLKLGYPFFNKYGKYFHLSHERLTKTSIWFDKFGKTIIIFAYFVPGLRHITGYFSGVSRISYKKFAFNAYLGAIIWITTFVTLGRALGPKWSILHRSMTKYGMLGGLALLFIVISYYLIKYNKNRIRYKTIEFLKTSLQIFHSLGRMKIVISLAAVTFFALFAFMIGLIQDFLGNEFTDFDLLFSYLVKSFYSSGWTTFMKVFLHSTSNIFVAVIVLMSVIWIFFKGADKLLEIKFLFFSILGGEIFATILQLLFHRSGLMSSSFLGESKYTFPSAEVLMSVVIYGYLCYMVLRHSKNIKLKAVVTVVVILVVWFTGQSTLYFKLQYPSDVLAGYNFGGVWLTLSIILLEIYRVLPRLKSNKN